MPAIGFAPQSLRYGARVRISDGAAQLPKVFIGSSTEGIEVCRYLQSELNKTGLCAVTVWDQDVFTASSYTLESLAKAAQDSDFAILVATPDDFVDSRSATAPAPRDNVIFELGLFVGALGRDRTYIVADKTDPKLRLPTDLLGITYLPFQRPDDGNMRGALTDPVLGISERIRALGVRHAQQESSLRGDRAHQALAHELDLVCTAALAQGWKVKKRSETTLRLESQRGRRHTLSLGAPAATRSQLREFVAELRADGLRVNRSVRQPASDSVHI